MREAVHHCQEPNTLHQLRIRSRSFGTNDAIVTRLLEERHCGDTQLRTVPEKIGAIFTITVYSTASANAVPEARSHSPTSSSHALKPDSKPSAWSHQSFAGIMIFCINACCRFCVSSAHLLCIRRHAPAPLEFLNGLDKSSDTAFRYQGQ